VSGIFQKDQALFNQSEISYTLCAKLKEDKLNVDLAPDGMFENSRLDYLVRLFLIDSIAFRGRRENQSRTRFSLCSAECRQPGNPLLCEVRISALLNGCA